MTAPPALARWTDGRVELMSYAAPLACGAGPPSEAPVLRMVLTATDDLRGWNLGEVEVAGEASGLWYADAERPVNGLAALVATGSGDLSFPAVTLELDDGSKVEVSSVTARWCGAPLASALATVGDDGRITVHQFDGGVLRHCDEQAYGDTTVTFSPFVTERAHGWGVASVSETESGATDDFAMSGIESHAATLKVSDSWLEATFAPLPPTESAFGPSERTRTVTGPLKAAWCGTNPPGEVGDSAPGTAGGWMRFGTRWFAIGGARWSKDPLATAKGGRQLELSTEALSCDAASGPETNALEMTLRVTGKDVRSWSVSGVVNSVPYTWNGDPLPAPTDDQGDVVLATTLEGMEVKGRVPVVHCE
ncbi:MAG: hypothetical protein ABMA64_15820 [Myxococcota bacterium]